MLPRLLDDLVLGALDLDRSMISVDVEESDKEVIVTAEIPGAKKENIKIELGSNKLTIDVQKEGKREHKTVYYHRIERSFGHSRREIDLPYEYDENTPIKATYEEGVLIITLPKPPKTHIREIPIE